MRLAIDLTKCQGYAQCAFAAPDVFTMHGDEALLYDPNPDEAQRERVLRAVAAAPGPDPGRPPGEATAVVTGHDPSERRATLVLRRR